jgi:hypothetical protein
MEFFQCSGPQLYVTKVESESIPKHSECKYVMIRDHCKYQLENYSVDILYFLMFEGCFNFILKFFILQASNILTLKDQILNSDHST